MSKRPPTKKDRYMRRLLAQLNVSTLCYEYKGTNGHHFFLEPGGQTVAPTVVARCVRQGLIVPNYDALLDGETQTYRRVSSERPLPKDKQGSPDIHEGEGNPSKDIAVQA